MSRTLSATSSVAVTVNWYVSCVSRSSFLLTVITPLQETPQQLHIRNQHMTQHPSNPASCPTVGSVRPNCPVRPSDPSDPTALSDYQIRQTQLPIVGSVRPNCHVRPSDPSDPTALSDRRIRQTQLSCPTVGSVRPNCPVRPSDQSDPTALSDRRIHQTQLPCPTVGSVRPNCPVRPSDPSYPTALSDCRIRHRLMTVTDRDDQSQLYVGGQLTCWRRWRSAHRRCRL